MSTPVLQGRVVDALRGLAALTVLMSHADHNNLVPLQLLTIPEVKGFLGDFGVGLFFIISGYLIWISVRNSLNKPNALSVYAVHRATRIMPLYYINVCCAALVVPWLGSHFVPEVSLASVLRHVTFTQDLSPAVSRTLNPVLWSITHEMLFYIVAPLLFMLVRQRCAELLVVVAALLYLYAIVFPGGLFSAFGANFYLFVVGILVAERVKSPLPLLWVLVAALLFAVGVVSKVFFTVKMVAMGAAVLFFLLASAVGPERVAGGGVLRLLLLPLASIGVVSYSLYIWHYLMLNVISANMRPIVAVLEFLHLDWIWTNGLYRGFFIVGLLLAVAAISYWLIEKPGMVGLRRRLLDRLEARRIPLAADRA